MMWKKSFIILCFFLLIGCEQKEGNHQTSPHASEEEVFQKESIEEEEKEEAKEVPKDIQEENHRLREEEQKLATPYEINEEILLYPAEKELEVRPLELPEKIADCPYVVLDIVDEDWLWIGLLKPELIPGHPTGEKVDALKEFGLYNWKDEKFTSVIESESDNSEARRIESQVLSSEYILIRDVFGRHAHAMDLSVYHIPTQEMKKIYHDEQERDNQMIFVEKLYQDKLYLVEIDLLPKIHEINVKTGEDKILPEHGFNPRQQGEQLIYLEPFDPDAEEKDQKLRLMGSDVEYIWERENDFSHITTIFGELEVGKKGIFNLKQNRGLEEDINREKITHPSFVLNELSQDREILSGRGIFVDNLETSPHFLSWNTSLSLTEGGGGSYPYIYDGQRQMLLRFESVDTKDMENCRISLSSNQDIGLIVLSRLKEDSYGWDNTYYYFSEKTK